MFCIHITENKNFNSIKKYGLLPHKPHISSHTEIFKSIFQKTSVVYLMEYQNKKRTEKFIKDFIYFRLWGTPRNIWANLNDSKKWSMVYDKFWKIEEKIFSILKIEVDLKKIKYLKAIHSQDNKLPLINDMDINYAHDDEPLIITPEIIESSLISHIGNGYPVIRNNKIMNVKLR